MQFSRENSIESLIFGFLKSGPQEPSRLLELVRTIRPKTTKQGLYATLRNLERQEIVVVQKKQASFNIRWLNHMSDFFSIAQSFYTTGDSGKDNFLNLREGEKISYSFVSPLQTDAFWWHALYILTEYSKTHEPAFLYNPHEWFLIARRESELECIKTVTKKRQFLMTVAGNSYLDKQVATDFNGERSQYYMVGKPLFPKNNYYFNIVDDFLIEVSIDKTIAQNLEKFYGTTKQFNNTIEEQLKSIVATKGKTKLTISRNYKKTEKIKKALRKHFYIKN